MASADQTRLREVVEAVVTSVGYDLEELTVVAAGRRRLLRVIIDSDAGVDLDDAADVSRRISAQLDEDEATDPMGAAAYTLEVTSPGIGRPLTMPRHFRRARGRLLAITAADGRSVLGRVLLAGDESVRLLVGKAGLDPLEMTYQQIAKAKVEVEFNAPSAAVLALLDPETAHKLDRDASVTGEDDPADEDQDDPEDDEDDPADDEDDDAAQDAATEGEQRA